MNDLKNIAIFASGSGSNAEEIIKYFDNHNYIKTCCILSNRKDAFVHQRAKKLEIPSFWFTKNEITPNGRVAEILEKFKTDYIILAGYMLFIPEWITTTYGNRILNIHPALLPKYGGKGMYGEHVHNAVIVAGEKESGITIHLVNNEYDKGSILFQQHCNISPTDTPDTLAEKIHQMEHEFYPKIIEQYIIQQNKS